MAALAQVVLYTKKILFIYKTTQAKAAILKSSVFEWSVPVVPVYWNGPFKIRTLRKPNSKMFGIGMVFGIPSSDFEPPLQLGIQIIGICSLSIGLLFKPRTMAVPYLDHHSANRLVLGPPFEYWSTYYHASEQQTIQIKNKQKFAFQIPLYKKGLP